MRTFQDIVGFVVAGLIGAGLTYGGLYVLAGVLDTIFP